MHPKAAHKHCVRFPPRKVVQEAFQDAGFIHYNEIKCTEPITGLRYYDCYGPFEKNFRKTMSFYADAEEYIDEYLQILKNMMEDGTLPKYLLEKEKLK